MSLSPAMRKRRVSIGVYTCDCGRWNMKESIQVDQYLPDTATKMRLRWFCDRSGIIFFNAVAGDNEHRRSEVYALSLDTKAVEKVASHVGDRDWGIFTGRRWVRRHIHLCSNL
ncbi:unnamed protein product [Miscanthus lutarioriparius]|uniref:Uncharacterized protein n=1 Tax=Miscanthus lutarioriparius TaxID=422564 RepID=A0A811PQB1_9POAL|nr:unnamed protein product [Miscanthus lutarioriparius]